MTSHIIDTVTRRANTCWDTLKTLANGKKRVKAKVDMKDDDMDRKDYEERAEIQHRNLEAFLKLLPGLLTKHESQYALIVNGELKEVREDRQSLIDYSCAKFPNAICLVQPIQKELPSSYVNGSLLQFS